MTAFDAKYKDKVAKKLATRLAEALKKEEINLEESRKIAVYILNNLKKTTDQNQLTEFLNQLGKDWPAFANISLIEKGEVIKQKEELATQKASELIKENRIDEAIQAVKTATEEKKKEQT
jgi:arsenate reductase-like glutaredoxin family protein